MPATVEQPTGSLANVDPADVVAAAEAEAKKSDKPAKLAKSIVKHMEKAGLIENDQDQTALTILKRVNHAIFANEPVGDIAAIQAEFRRQLAEADGDITKLTEGGAESPVYKIVDSYLAGRQKHFEKSARELAALPRSSMGTYELNTVEEEAQAKADKYSGEREAYARMPQLINETVAKYPQVFDAYHNIGELAEISGIVKGEPKAVREKIDDVMAEVAAARLFDIAPKVMSLDKGTLKNMVDYPKEYSTNIILAAEHTALHTTGLERLNLFDTPGATTELKRIIALNTLLSAHLHALTSHNRNTDGTSNPGTETLAQNIAQIPELVRNYQMAGASLVHEFLTEGESAKDAKMQSLDGNFAELAEKRRIPLLPAEEAERAAKDVVNTSAEYLREKYADRPDLLSKIDTLVAQATAKVSEKSFAGREEAPASTFAADAAKAASAVTAAAR